MLTDGAVDAAAAGMKKKKPNHAHRAKLGIRPSLWAHAHESSTDGGGASNNAARACACVREGMHPGCIAPTVVYVYVVYVVHVVYAGCGTAFVYLEKTFS